MKKTALLLPVVLFMMSCESEVTIDKNEILDDIEETMSSTESDDSNQDETASTTEFKIPEGSQAWSDFVAEYDKEYNMADGNPSWDGKEVTFTGMIEKVVDYEDSEGNEYAQACFGIVDEMMGKNQLSALFDPMQSMVLESAQEADLAVTIKGKVKKKKFGEIVIESCEMIFE